MLCYTKIIVPFYVKLLFVMFGFCCCRFYKHAVLMFMLLILQSICLKNTMNNIYFL